MHRLKPANGGTKTPLSKNIAGRSNSPGISQFNSGVMIMSKSRGPVKKLMDKKRVADLQHGIGAFPRWSKHNAECDNRAGGNATLHDTTEKRAMVEIYNQQAGTIQVDTTIRRVRRPAIVMVGVNEVLTGRSRGGSLVECILRERE